MEKIVCLSVLAPAPKVDRSLAERPGVAPAATRSELA